MEPHGDIGERLRALRILYEGDTHGSQKAFAKRLGITEQRWGNYERGRRRPNHDLATKIKKMCGGVTRDWIYDGDVAGMPFELLSKLQEQIETSVESS